jgi:phosphatidate cytidylyltransferase
MALYLPTFCKRTASALVFALVMVAGLFWHDWAFTLLIGLIQFFCLREYFRLMANIFSGTKRPVWLPVLLQILGVLLVISLSPLDLFADQPAHRAWLGLSLIPTLLLLGSVLGTQNSLQGFLQGLGGLFYISLPLLLLLLIRNISMVIPIVLIFMIWTNDTMAYLVGSFIGKTPFSKISPKKTWEGTIGGAILTVVGAILWGYFTPYYRLVDWMMIALIVGVAGTAGDLLESKLKRMAQVKDSGTLMPGHGGALDRFDSLLVAAPFTFAYAYLFMPPVPLVIF